MEENGATANCPEKSLGEKVHTWVQTVGIIIASILAFLWGVYTFIYKEIIIPKSAPVNITLDLSLQKSGTNVNLVKNNERPLSAIELKIAAKNPSTRSIYLLPSVLVVYGNKISKPMLAEDQVCSSKISSNTNWYNTIYPITRENRKVVAFGNLLTYDALYPNEVEAKTFVFHVPKGEYDVIEVYVFIPSVAQDNSGFRLEWEYDKEKKEPISKIFYKPANHWFSWLFGKGSEEREFLKPDEKGKINEYDLKLSKKLELQEAHSMSMISLWEESKSDGSQPLKPKAD